MITQDKKIANHLNYIFSNLGEFFGAKKPPNYNKSASESAPFQNTLRLPTANYRLNKRTKQIIFDKHCSTASLQKSFFHLTSKKWNSLPIILRNLEKSRTGFKKKLKEFYVSELRNNPICTNTNTWRDFRFC